MKKMERTLGNSVRKIFVTGGAGFIGSHVVDCLMAQDYQVCVYDNLSNGRREYVSAHFENPNFTFIQADILDMERLRNASRDHDLVWHLAANTDIIGGAENPRRDLQDCAAGAFNVVEAMRLNNIKPLLFSSTGAVYGELCRDRPVNEQAGPLLPVSTYAAGKIGGEAFISAYCHLYGLRAWIFRFGNVIGRRMTHGVIYDFIHKLRANPDKLLIRGDGRQEKNYFLVEECIDGMGWAFRNIPMTAENPCDIFNLGTATISRVTDIAEIIRNEMELPAAGIAVEGTPKAWPGDQPRVHITVERMRRLGWTAKHTSDEAVRIAVRRMLGKE
jgi:UDP-glucose 4-epimerase